MKAKNNRSDRMGKKRLTAFQVVEDKCIWMKAGIVNFRLCDNGYDCNNCPFDRGMRKTMNVNAPFQDQADSPSWVEYLRKRFRGSDRPCRHTLTGRVDAPKKCIMNYECYHCAYDQMLYEEDLNRLVGEPSYQNVSGFKIADGYYYHMGHSWIRFEHGGLARVGMDDFAVKLFGAVQELSLPPLGASLKQDEAGWTFSRDGNKAAMLSPLSGKLLTTNYRAWEHPEITHQDPYQSGWLFILEPDLPKRNLKRLFYDKECFQWIEQEFQQLLGLIGPQYEEMVATGGEIVSDIYGNIPGLEWERLVDMFLHTEGV